MADNSLPIISKEAAIAAGKTRYFTGVPCKHGHVAERFVSTRGCIICHKANTKAYVAAHRDAGQARYFTGKPCRNGHVAQRMVSNRQCVECLQQEKKRRLARYADEAVAYYRKEQGREYQRRWRLANPEAEERRRNNQYSGQEFIKIKKAGRGRALQCELCGEEKETFFDHCHHCKEFRGWLCSRCNWTLGHVKDSPELLSKMIGYLEKHNGCIKNRHAQKASC